MHSPDRTAPAQPWKALWRRFLTAWFTTYQWPTVGLLAVVALVLGYLGFRAHLRAIGEPASFWDLAYLSLQLFALESGAAQAPVPVPLELARFLAPVLTGYIAYRAFWTLLGEQFISARARRARDHVVVCGLGRKGFALAKDALARDLPVVAVERDPQAPQVQACRREGAIVLIGNATDREILRKARVERARWVFAVTGDDGINAEAAVHTRDLKMTGSGGATTCFAHVFDLGLCRLLQLKELAAQVPDRFRVEYFNVFEIGARALLDRHSPFKAGGPPPHLLIVGLGRFGETLAVEAARRWHSRRASAADRLHLTLVDRESRKLHSLLARYPAMETTCEIDARAIDTDSPDFLRGGFAESGLSAAYVCLDDDSRALRTALALRQRTLEAPFPIIVRMVQDAGLAALLRGEDPARGEYDQLYAFGLLDRACTLELVLGGAARIIEVLARAIHEEYVRNERRRGQTPETNASMVPWEQLPEHLKESNRRQADHIGVMLHMIGCTLLPRSDWTAEPTEFTPDEVERMAPKEHERFVAERVGEGWTYASAKDVARKTSPYLVPWGELPEEIRQIDRNAVRQWPAILAKAGFGIHRRR